MNVLGYLRTFVRARPGGVVLSLALWLAQSLAELAPGLIVKPAPQSRFVGSPTAISASSPPASA